MLREGRKREWGAITFFWVARDRTYLRDSCSRCTRQRRPRKGRRCASSCRASARWRLDQDQRANSRPFRCRSWTIDTQSPAQRDRPACTTVDSSPECVCAPFPSARSPGLAQRPTLWCTCAECLSVIKRLVFVTKFLKKHRTWNADFLRKNSKHRKLRRRKYGSLISWCRAQQNTKTSLKVEWLATGVSVASIDAVA